MSPARMAMASPELSVEHVGVRFGGLEAIADLNFSVAKGETVGLIGGNGAGKTTVFNVITGFLRPTHGEVRYRTASLARLNPHQVAALGLVRTFQRTSVFADHTVLENVLIGTHRSGSATLWDTLFALPRARRSEQAMRDDAMSVLRLVGIDRRAADVAGTLPYGEQRLLGVALALAAKPSMLLLDEPVSGMNPSETARFVQLLDRVRSAGLTILLVEHDMPMVMGVCDRLVVLNHGRVIAEGPPCLIQKDPEVIRAYLGQGGGRRA